MLAGQPAGSGMIVRGLFSVELRDELRGALVGALGWEEVLDRWLGLYPLVARVRSERGRASVRYEAASGAGFAGWVAAVVARTLQEGTWERL
jgi:hypothetical protein